MVNFLQQAMIRVLESALGDLSLFIVANVGW